MNSQQFKKNIAQYWEKTKDMSQKGFEKTKETFKKYPLQSVVVLFAVVFLLYLLFRKKDETETDKALAGVSFGEGQAPKTEAEKERMVSHLALINKQIETDKITASYAQTQQAQANSITAMIEKQKQAILAK